MSVNEKIAGERKKDGWSLEELVNQKMVSMKEANKFLELKCYGARTVANATSMCILSPLLLIIMGTMAEDKVLHLTETLAAGAGLVFLFGLIAAAVFLFITYGIRESHMEHLEKESFETESEVSIMVCAKRESYEPVFARGIAVGVVLCILSVIPVILAGVADAPDYMCGISVGVLLLLVAIGVNLIIRVSMVNGSYDALLQEGEFSRKEKRIKRKMDAFSSAYWCLATAIYLGWSFWSRKWDITWSVWPVAGCLYATVYSIIKMMVGNRKEVI